MANPLVGVVMGSASDWDVMQHAVRRLDEFAIPNEAKVISAHRSPDLALRYGAGLSVADSPASLPARGSGGTRRRTAENHPSGGVPCRAPPAGPRLAAEHGSNAGGILQNLRDRRGGFRMHCSAGPAGSDRFARRQTRRISRSRPKGSGNNLPR
jgi:hypothetical protein